MTLRQGHLDHAAEVLRDVADTRIRFRLRELKQRPENWDGYGSLPANSESVARAAAIVETMINQAEQAGFSWVDPHVGLNESGHVLFEWWHGEKALALYIRPDTTDYVKSWGPNMETEMEADALSAEDFPRFWYWLQSF